MNYDSLYGLLGKEFIRMYCKITVHNIIFKFFKEPPQRQEKTIIRDACKSQPRAIVFNTMRYRRHETFRANSVSYVKSPNNVREDNV